MKKTLTYDELTEFGVLLGRNLRGSELIELVGDVGAGKTTLTKALAKGLGIKEDVQSPSFTISRTYPARDNLMLYHYDFYRLEDPGIMRYELEESLHDSKIVTVIEWAGSVNDVLPPEHIVIRLEYTQDETVRQIEVSSPLTFRYIEEGL